LFNSQIIGCELIVEKLWKLLSYGRFKIEVPKRREIEVLGKIHTFIYNN